MLVSSYKSDFTQAELARTVLKKQRVRANRPACPNCKQTTYVKPFVFGFIECGIVFTKEDEEEKPEERGAPHGPVYEGYGWDCPRCLIIFSDPKKDIK